MIRWWIRRRLNRRLAMDLRKWRFALLAAHMRMIQEELCRAIAS